MCHMNSHFVMERMRMFTDLHTYGQHHVIQSLSKNINPSLVLVQPRKTRPFITERLLMGRKESNQTNKNHVIQNQCGLYPCIGSSVGLEVNK